MNIDKILGSVSDLWARHSPTVIMHVAMFVLLQWWVLDASHLIAGSSLWESVKHGVDGILSETGFKIERGYAIAAVVYVYLTVVQWLARAITNLPGLRTWFTESTLDLNMAQYAGRVLQTDPDMYVTLDKLRNVVDDYVRAYREREQSEPYFWLEREVSRWSRFYGLSVLFIVVNAIWLFQGSIGAASADRVLQLLLLLVLFSGFSRWRLMRKHVYLRTQLRYAALREYQNAHPAKVESGELDHLRNQMLAESIHYWRSYQRSPVTIIRRLGQRLPPSITKQLFARIAYLPGRSVVDWQVLSSYVSLHAENTVSPPAALSTKAYESRFSSLLECRGAGLCILVDRESGMAPSVAGGGSEYCFATRRHDGYVLPIKYDKWGPNGSDRLSIRNYRKTWGFFAHVGLHRIELVIQKQFPDDVKDKDWWKLIRADETSTWTATDFEKDTSTFPEMSSRMPIQLGHTYLLRTKLETETEVVVALQCFGTGDETRVLVAWKILDVTTRAREIPEILPWWKIQAWQNLLAERVS